MKGFLLGVIFTLIIVSIGVGWLWLRGPEAFGDMIADFTPLAPSSRQFTGNDGKRKKPGKIYLSYGEYYWDSDVDGRLCEKTLHFQNETEFRLSYAGEVVLYESIQNPVLGKVTQERSILSRHSFDLPAKRERYEELHARGQVRGIKCDVDEEKLFVVTKKCDLENHTEYQCLNTLEFDKSIRRLVDGDSL